MTVKNRLQQFRKAKKLTQTELAKLLNTQPQRISEHEKGLYKPNIDFFIKLKEVVPELNLDWLLSGSGEMFISNSIVTGNIKGNNITLQNNAKCECSEDKELEMLHGFRKLSDEKKKYYYHKIIAESLEG